MIRYISCYCVAALLQLFCLVAQDSAHSNDRLINFQWDDFKGHSLNSLISALNIPYRPYHISEDKAKSTLLTLLIHYSDSQDIQLQLRLKFDVYSKPAWKLRLWDSLCTTQCIIRDIQVMMIDRIDEQAVRNRYCMELVLYHYSEDTMLLCRRVVMSDFYSFQWEQLEPAIQEQFRLGFVQLTGQKP